MWRCKMIEKSRLEELINQGATIYEAKYGKVNPIDFTKQKVRFISEKQNMIEFEPSMTEKYLNHKYFHRLYETKEQAEWASKYQHIPRTEWLDLPTWEDWQRLHKYGQYATSFYNKGNYYELIVFFDKIKVTKQNYGLTTLFEEPATEENYIKACDLCVKLFKGE